MRKLFRLSSIYAALSIFLAVSTGATALAATTSSTSGSGVGNGYKIAPVRTDLTINKGSSQTTTVFVQNVSATSENLQVVINDFQANPNESGAPSLFLNGQSAPSHGLRQYVTISSPSFTLDPNQQKPIEVKITIPANAAAGGYYGAVRVAPAGAVGDKNVNLAASVASLILVKVPGSISEQLTVASLQAASGSSPHVVFTNGKNLNAIVRFRNNGNVQEEPFGKIQLKKGSTVLHTYEVNNNDPRGNVLPGSVRKFSIGLEKLNSFGRYTLEGNFGYGSNGQLLSASTSFYIIPVMSIVLIAIVILVVLFLIFWLPRIIRGHDQRVLRRASRR